MSEPTLSRRHAAVLWWQGPVSGALLLVKTIAVPHILDLASGIVDTVLSQPNVGERDVVIFGAGEIASAYVPLQGALQHRPVPRSLALISPTATTVVVTREDARTLRVDAPGGAFRHAIERLSRGAPFVAGERSVLTTQTVDVLEVDSAGDLLAFRATFPRDLDDPGYLWMIPGDGVLRPWTPPRVGDSVTITPLLPLP